MLTRAAALLVLLAALLQAAPVVPSAVSVRWSAAVVSVRTEREHQRQLRAAPLHQRRSRAAVRLPRNSPRAFSGYAPAQFQRPPPARG
ncbi:MAG: hypothetical protein JNM66_27505 [Bryobacterales bacterium]|nr:hypothetical protein [Bryobacterales bacterium]